MGRGGADSSSSSDDDLRNIASCVVEFVQPGTGAAGPAQEGRGADDGRACPGRFVTARERATGASDAPVASKVREIYDRGQDDDFPPAFKDRIFAMLAAKIERDVEVASSATAPPASPRKSDGPGPGTKNAKKRKRERGGTEAAQAAERDEGPAPPRAPGAGTDDASARDDASGSCSPHGGPLGVRLFRRTAPGKVFRVSEGGMTFVPGAAPDSYRDARADLASPRRGGRTWAAEFRPVEPPRAEAKQRLRACAVDPAALLARAERGGYDAKQPGGVLAAGRRAEGSVVRDGRCGDVEYGPRRHGVAGGAGAAKLLGL